MPSNWIFSAPAYARSRAAPIDSPRPITLSTRPPFVTRPPSRSAVPAWKTSAPVSSAATTPRMGVPRLAARRIVPVAKRDADGGLIGRGQLDAASSPWAQGSERLEQVALDQRTSALVSGSPKRQLNSMTRMPSAVRISPP